MPSPPTRPNRPLETPTFRQVVVLTRDALAMHPTDRSTDQVEGIKLRHLSLGFRYSTAQIHRALAAIAHVSTPQSNRRSGR